MVGGGSAVIPARRECFVVNSAGRRLSSSVGMQFRPSPAIATLQFNDLEIVNQRWRASAISASRIDLVEGFVPGRLDTRSLVELVAKH